MQDDIEAYSYVKQQLISRCGNNMTKQKLCTSCGGVETFEERECSVICKEGYGNEAGTRADANWCK